ncbi:hypothetical protein [Nonomuraea lactucae]|uniref:hypothetical protein n=1 Tax=Nonomuraea lactucae TaxID=2249762 RepID=UPI0013B3BEF8|nr:hypothetical protein [Nonomuraea lactucae]
MSRTRYRGLVAAGALAAAVLAGCGSPSEPASPSASPAGTAAPSPPGAATTSAAAEPSASARPSSTPGVHTVTLEVLGKGKATQPIVYVADTNGSESDATLPWSKTVTIELNGAEQQIGRPVSVVAPSVKAESGMLEASRCRITVDGEEVETGRGRCEYVIKFGGADG